MKNVNRIIALMVMVTAFASCGVLRKNKQKESHQIDQVSKRDSIDLSTSTSSGEVKERTVDNGVIVTEREITTTTTKRGKKVDAKVNKNDLKHGDNFIKDSAGLLVNIILDTLAGTLGVQFDQPGETTTKTERERITDNKNQTTNKEEKQEQRQENQVAVTGEQRRSEKSSSTVSNSQPSATGVIGNWIGAAIAVLLVVIGLVWWFLGKGKKDVEYEKLH